MPDVYLIQLIGVLIAATGAVALTACAYLYGTPLTREERRRHGDQHGNGYRLLFNMETVASGLVFLGGIGILLWAKFDLCLFLAHWLPELPEVFRLFISCR